jgi:hypothetical protein
MVPPLGRMRGRRGLGHIDPMISSSTNTIAPLTLEFRDFCSRKCFDPAFSSSSSAYNARATHGTSELRYNPSTSGIPIAYTSPNNICHGATRHLCEHETRKTRSALPCCRRSVSVIISSRPSRHPGPEHQHVASRALVRPSASTSSTVVNLIQQAVYCVLGARL